MSKRQRLAGAWLAAVALAAAGALGNSIRAQEKASDTRLTTAHYLDWERVSDAQIAPDGARIVYTRQHVNKLKTSGNRSCGSSTRTVRRTASSSRASAARWSPDGKRIMYLGEGEPKGAQIFVQWVDADGPATQVTQVTKPPRNARGRPTASRSRSRCSCPSTAKLDDRDAAGAEGRKVDAGAALRPVRCTTGRTRSGSSRTASPTCSSSPPTAVRRVS